MHYRNLIIFTVSSNLTSNVFQLKRQRNINFKTLRIYQCWNENMVGRGQKSDFSFASYLNVCVSVSVYSLHQTQNLKLYISSLYYLTNLYFFKKLLGTTQCPMVLQEKWQSGSICGCWNDRVCGVGPMFKNGVGYLIAAVKIQARNGLQPCSHMNLKISNVRTPYCQE